MQSVRLHPWALVPVFFVLVVVVTLIGGGSWGDGIAVGLVATVVVCVAALLVLRMRTRLPRRS